MTIIDDSEEREEKDKNSITSEPKPPKKQPTIFLKRTRKGDKKLSMEVKKVQQSNKTKRVHIDISPEEKKDEPEDEKPVIIKASELADF